MRPLLLLVIHSLNATICSDWQPFTDGETPQDIVTRATSTPELRLDDAKGCRVQRRQTPLNNVLDIPTLTFIAEPTKDCADFAPAVSLLAD
eukprot:m.104773 g.104773  ORF g.104773 m.104773 type:complete len:91 (-) comp51614_c0_seq6:112-384(-)